MTGKSRFRKLVARQDVATPRLPTVHSTDAYRFTDAMADDAISPRPCSVFKQEKLVYLFYGRPSYRVNPDVGPSGLSHSLPICILFQTDTGLNAKRIFPFDSGAFVAGRYDSAMHRDMKVEDFGLEPDPSTPGRLISLFFDSVDDYVLARPKRDMQLNATDFEAAAYHALVTQSTVSNSDDRGSAIEIQVGTSLRLSELAEAIVGPGPLLGDPQVSAFLKRAGIVPLPYEQLGRQQSSDHVSDLFRICREYYRRSDNSVGR